MDDPRIQLLTELESFATWLNTVTAAYEARVGRIARLVETIGQETLETDVDAIAEARSLRREVELLWAVVDDTKPFDDLP